MERPRTGRGWKPGGGEGGGGGEPGRKGLKQTARDTGAIPSRMKTEGSHLEMGLCELAETALCSHRGGIRLWLALVVLEASFPNATAVARWGVVSVLVLSGNLPWTVSGPN